MLDILVRCAKQQVSRSSNGFRYERCLKLIATYLYLVGGRILYDTLAANLPFPHISTIFREINSNVLSLLEGACRVHDLKKFLEAGNLKPCVWLSEDATRITGRVQHDSNTNQIVGFVLPFNDEGMPISGSFLATSAKAIQDFFLNHSPASSLHTIMAQPLYDKAPSFCILLFGTDNKFSTEHVLKRWEFTVKLLREHNIRVLGMSSDGDTRLMKAMRVKTSIGIGKSDFSAIDPDFNLAEFHSKVLPPFICTQDTVHVGAKLKTRLLKPSIIMPLGKFFIPPGHLSVLINNFSKDKHLLTPSDLSSKDKMNFASVIKICDPKIWNLLKLHVPGSEGTVLYLQMMYFVIISYLSKTMTIADRIYFLWYSVFFIRLWRAWIDRETEYSLTNNCITSKTYLCIELNAHALLNSIFSCIEEGSTDNFLPWLFGSQQCESFYRNLRSMSTTFSTVVNCSLLEAIHRIYRIQIQADISIMDFKAEGENLIFPRTRHLNTNYEIQDEKINSPTAQMKINHQFPNHLEIKQILALAKKSAHESVIELGMSVNITKANNIQSRNVFISEFCADDAKDVSNDEDDFNDLNGDFESREVSEIDPDTAQDLTILSSRWPLVKFN